MKEYLINAKKYRLNIFDKLDPESAYLIGYLAGDGIFNQPTHKRKARLSVSSVDTYLIEMFQRLYCPDTAVNYKVTINKKYNIKTEKKTATLAFSSKFSPLFNKYGVLGLKNDRRIVNIPRNLMRHYLRGFFDADGHISYGHRKDRDRLWANIGFTHSSFEFLSSIQRIMEEELNIATTVRPRRDEACYDLKFGNMARVAAFVEWLYAEPSVLFNHRKQRKASMFLNEYKAALQPAA